MITSDRAFPLGSRIPPARGLPGTGWRALRRLNLWTGRGKAVSQSLYLPAVIAAGTLVILASAWQVIIAPVAAQWVILAALTILGGAATLRMPDVPVSFSISDSFTITAALLFGPAAGALMVAIDSLVISFRLARHNFTLQRLFFNTAAPALAMWIAAQIFFLLVGVGPLLDRTAPLGPLVGALVAFAALYFALNTGLIAGVVALERRTKLSVIWRHHFRGLWLTHFGGASVAGLLIVLIHSGGPSLVVLALVAPIPLILHATFKNAVGRMEDQLGHLRQVNRMHLATIETLAHAIDAKDQVTHGHIRRVQQYAVRLARALGINDQPQLSAIEAASLLHDLGKLAVPEHILNKPSRLTPTEFESMKRHAAIGADILSTVGFPYPVVPIVRHHHEHWDGGGYPDGLKGEAIPIGARILSVVDCFDALTSDRPYRLKLSNSDALRILRERSGRMYDPEVVAEFVKLHHEQRFEPDATPVPQALTAIALTAQSDALSYSRRTEPHDPALLTAFYDLGRDVAAASDASDAIESVHRALKAMMPAACTAIFVYSPTEDRVIARWVAGQHGAAVQGLSIPLGQRLTGWVAANRSTIVNSDAALDLGNLTMRLAPPPHGCLSTAIHVHAELFGALTIYSTGPEPFNEAHAKIVEAVASRLAPLVQRTVGAAVMETSSTHPLPEGSSPSAASGG